MKSLKIFFAGILFLLTSIINIANASLISVEDTIFFCDESSSLPGESCGGLYSFTLDIPTLMATSAGTLTMELNGDFANELNFVNFSITGSSLNNQNLLNNIEADDLFGGVAFDVGSLSYSNPLLTLDALISLSTLNNIAGRSINMTLMVSDGVNNLDELNGASFAKVKLAYQSVPEPSSLLLFSLGLLAMTITGRVAKKEKK